MRLLLLFSVLFSLFSPADTAADAARVSDDLIAEQTTYFEIRSGMILGAESLMLVGAGVA